MATDGPAVRWERIATRTVVVVLATLAVLHAIRHGGDFEVYWRSARRFLAGEPLYPDSDGLHAYRYAPGALVFVVPFALLPLKAATFAWYAVLVGLAAGVSRTLVRQMGGGRAGLAVLVGFAGVARPFLDEFLYAQANVVVLWLVVAATAAEDAGEDLRGGLLVGLATGLKLTPALFLVDFLLRRRWRALAGAAAAGALLAAAPVVTYGVAGAVGVHREWFRSLRHSAPALVGSYMNQGVFGIVAHATQDRLDGPIPPGPATWLAVALAGAVVVVALAARYPQPRRGMLLVAMAAAGPLGWIWNFVYAWPLLAWLAARGPRARLAVAAAGLALCIPIYDIAGPRIEDWVFGHSLPGLVMLGFLGAAAWASARRDAPGAEA